ncbi:MAG: cupin domain-containing protein [Oscillospiraceae bacterium]
MVISNWRDSAPTIVHDCGIDWKLLKGQENFDPAVPNYCMKGMLYVAYAMLQSGHAYEGHVHDDHEEIYFIISGTGEIQVGDEVRSFRDGDAIYIPLGAIHSIKNTGEDFVTFLAFSSQIDQDKK